MKVEAYQEDPWAESRFLNFVTTDIWQDNSLLGKGRWGGAALWIGGCSAESWASTH